MCITLRYMDTQDTATLNISCFTCGRKPERNDVFADQTLMSCEKYEQWRHANYSSRDNQQLTETSKNFHRGLTEKKRHNIPDMGEEKVTAA